ncbi:5-(carboxyamino)imidazole ribonucleotide synthase [Tuberibacillus sp. Marseille-P3662]|uniref:5-(carboxyamino)imidazole ribonucleotide synthase n=1 Tax=Tuberibacillus sp. Marseille-P3662 TaxID=1965358 RepID=UPI000A1CA9BF|nr:5-(carboxyamino)imidazole ribonucleotide synthase [Tuberibacillus sp. Marseille-P3662]
MAPIITPGQTIGILGGGQLGRMMTISAKEMGYRVIVLDPKPDAPCGQVADEQVVAAYDDAAAVQQLSEMTDVITYEFENVDINTAKFLEAHAYMPQGSELLEITSDRLREKATLASAEVPVAPYAAVSTSKDLDEGLQLTGYPAVLKTASGGYDGKGQYVIQSEDDAEALRHLLTGDRPYVLEQWVAFDKEISVIVTRSSQGEQTMFPVGENHHENNILHHTIVPAKVDDVVIDQAKQVAHQVADAVQLVGTLGVEMFVQADGTVVVNELAPRPHNSGHYTIEACETSQFRQHIRAICGWPLASTSLLKPAVSVNILGEHVGDVLESISEIGEANIHFYGKDAAKQGRKMGHVTLLADTTDQALSTLTRLNIWPTLDMKETTT